jgi:hypothetical protein
LKLQQILNYEKAIKDPENQFVKFKPDVAKSQESFIGRSSYESVRKSGFNNFLMQMDQWQLKKERKIRDIQTEMI